MCFSNSNKTYCLTLSYNPIKGKDEEVYFQKKSFKYQYVMRFHSIAFPMTNHHFLECLLFEF
jgi:hypothetical protein